MRVGWRYRAVSKTSASAAMRYVGDTSESLLVSFRFGRAESATSLCRHAVADLCRDASASVLVTQLQSVVDLLGQSRTLPPFCTRAVAWCWVSGGAQIRTICVSAAARCLAVGRPVGGSRAAGSTFGPSTASTLAAEPAIFEVGQGSPGPGPPARIGPYGPGVGDLRPCPGRRVRPRVIVGVGLLLA